MMAMNQLGKTIVKMKKKDLGDTLEKELSMQEQLNENVRNHINYEVFF